MIKSKMVNDDRSKEELKAEGWSLSNEVSIKDGEYIYSPYFKGTAYVIEYKLLKEWRCIYGYGVFWIR